MSKEIILSPGSVFRLSAGAGISCTTKELSDYFDSGQLLAQWPLWGDDLTTDITSVDSPDTFDDNPPWVPTRVTPQGDHHTILETTDTATHYLTQTVSIAHGPVESVSFDVEGIGRTWCEIQLTINHYAWFEISGSGSVGTQSLCTASIQELTSEGHPGRYRCTVQPTGAVVASGAYLRFLGSTGNGTNSYTGDVAKGYVLYNTQIDQTSIVTAPNLYGDQMLALYGDRFDLTNVTKASQPVLVNDAWNGLPAAVFSGANSLGCIAIAAQFSGDDKPAVFLASVISTSGSTAENFCALSKLGTGVNRHQWQRYQPDTVQRVFRRDAVTASVTLPGTANWAADTRYVLGQRFTGTQLQFYQNAILDGALQAANVGDVPFDQFTVGAIYGLVDPLFGVLREIAAGISATDAQMIAASNYLMGRNPIT